ISVSAKTDQLRVTAHVLAEQDPVGMSTRQQLDQQLDRPLFADAFPLPRHPDEVELEAGAARDDLEIVVEDRVRIGVTEDDAGWVEALLLEDPELGQTDVGQDGMRRDGQAGAARGSSCRTMDAFLGR